MDDDSEQKKAKETNRYIIKRILELMKSYYNYNKDLKAKHIKYTLNKSTRLY